uniref:Reverse transcriptase domain-containing protein n=1 Tax=Biomphalaria glabrata TaxID=6526 RepID=A0A2C9M3C4_BIOGL
MAVFEIFCILGQGKIFSKLDIKEAYWHVLLDEKSSLPTTRITPYGRYRWSRLTFGLSVSREIFQKKLTEALLGLEGCINVVDDIMIVGCGMADEIRQMDETCTACQERKPMNQRETLIQHVPWENVGADLMKVDGRLEYLITVDYYSNFIEYDYLSTTSQEVIRKLKGLFARFGVPKMLILKSFEEQLAKHPHNLDAVPAAMGRTHLQSGRPLHP